MEDKELYNPQNGEVIKVKRPKQFWKDWRFYVYTLIAIMLAIVSFSSCLTACAAINAGVGQNQGASYSVAQRKNALSTDSNTGITSYRFSLPNDYSNVGEGEIYTAIYIVDTNFDLTLYPAGVVSETVPEDYNSLVTVLNTRYQQAKSTNNNELRFMHSTFKYKPYPTAALQYGEYFSFVLPSAYSNQIISLPFILTNATNASFTRLDEFRAIYNGTFFNLTLEPSQLYVYYSSVPSYQPNFQDVPSYYQELGYQDGYGVGNSQGYSSGYDVGHSAGYNEGYASGNANGYASGYEQATQDYQTGIAFTSYGLYANAQLTLTTDEVIGNYSYMYLFKYVTSNYDEHTVYVLFTQNSSTSQYLGYVLDRNDSDDSTNAVTIGSFSAQSSLAVTITAEQDQYFELYTGFVTSFFDRGSEVIEAVWFSGGTSQTALQNYQDGYDTGYQDGVSAGYGSGYDAGYRVGEVAGINQAEPEALTNTLVAVFQQPFNQIYRFFNFNILGLNVLGLATGLLSVFIIIKVFKKVLK